MKEKISAKGGSASDGKKYYWIIILLIFFLLGIIIGVRIMSGEDDWTCQDGEWVTHGKPDSAKPYLPCEK